MRFLDWLFGCTHSNLSWPRTERKRLSNGWMFVRNYRVCLECGKEVEYSGELTA